MDGRHRYEALEAAREQAGLGHDDLWLRYFSLTGEAAPIEVEAYLQGMMPLPTLQEDILAQALRECLIEEPAAGEADDTL
jgi:hypothetical protein